ncbi:GntR family transcriptional regulator [Leucobacter soli]|uniref:GntR family transcriptional regulator n=1 Tax=Leucobacter soli TaxID=2812850 RepID=UPI00361F9538
MRSPILSSSAVAADADEVSGQQVGGIAERIASAISLGMLAVGERLPAEIELANQFGVAVATLRKALASLRAQGIVETRRGATAAPSS